MDRGAWQATVCGVARAGHNLASKPHVSRVQEAGNLFGVNRQRLRK